MKKIAFILSSLTAILVSNVAFADLTDDPNNCGQTGYVCLAGRDCVDSVCTPAWIEISETDAPEFRGKAQATVFDNKFVVLGGCPIIEGDSSPSTTAGTYDLSNDTWSSFSTNTEPRGQSTAISGDGNIYLISGLDPCFDGTTVGPQAEIFNGTSWSTISDSPAAYNMQSVYLGSDSVFVGFGADNIYSALRSAFILDSGGNWTDVSCNISGCNQGGYFSLFLDNGFIKVFGSDTYGSDGGGLKFDTTLLEWSSWELPVGTPAFSSVSPDGDGIRYADDGQRLYYMNYSGNDVLIYDRSLEEWTEDTSTPPSGLCQEGATTWVNGEIIVWSGVCGGLISEVGARYQPPAPGAL
jgi:hypothetical protein